MADATLSPPGTSTDAARPTSRLALAAMASLGAGAIHAAAIGVHAETRPAAIAFTMLAVFQLSWGVLALMRDGRLVAAIGVVGNAGAVVGWVVAKTSGISFIEGLEEAESIQTADALAAGLALASIVAVAFALALGPRSWRVPSLNLSALLVTALAVPGLLAAGSHDHGGADHGHMDVAAAGASHDHAASEDGAVSAEPASHHEDAVAVPYDPTKPIDLGGVEGVTPEQQAAAENLVAVTLTRLPRWSDPAVAEAAGFRTIGDGRTGVEHFVHQGFMDDDVILDPDQPESLVFDTSDGGRRLVAAMYMVKPGTPLDQVPNVGGDLMQWHTHDNLCFNAQGRVAGLTDGAGNCPASLVKPVETPMIHVWIESHRCGPFAALEGIGGGRIEDGETRLCDHAHGA